MNNKTTVREFIRDFFKYQNIIAMVLGTIFALTLGEIILQIINIPPHPVSGWTNCKLKNPGECNYLGFRGREINYSSNDFVVLLVGDSELYASHLPFDKMPERQLEYFLSRFKDNVKVFTIADMGYGQDQQYLALKKYFKDHRADLVILMLTFRDDLVNNVFPVSGLKDSLKPTYYISNGVLYGPTEDWLGSVSGYWLKVPLLLRYNFWKSPGKIRHEYWENNILPEPYVPFDHYQGEVDYSWQKEWEMNPKIAHKGIEFQKEGPVNQMTPRSARWEYAIELTRELILKIRDLVESNGANFILVKELRPWELSSSSEKVYYLKGKYYKTSMKQYRKNLNDLLQGLDAIMIELDSSHYKPLLNDSHLPPEAMDEVLEKLSLEIYRRNYFNLGKSNLYETQ